MRDAGRDQRVGARAGAAGVRARFERDDGGAAARRVARRGQRDDLGVRAAGRCGRALAGQRAVRGEDHRADRRVRAGAAAHRLGQRQRAVHGGLLGLADLHSPVARPLSRAGHRGTGLNAQRLDRLPGIVGAVHGGPGDEDVGAGLGGGSMVSAVDAAVDLEEQPQVPGSDVLAGQPHLGQHLGHELLAAEAGLDRHHQQRVELAQHLEVRLERRARLDRQPGERAGRADGAGGLHGVARPPRRGT